MDTAKQPVTEAIASGNVVLMASAYRMLRRREISGGRSVDGKYRLRLLTAIAAALSTMTSADIRRCVELTDDVCPI